MAYAEYDLETPFGKLWVWSSAVKALVERGFLRAVGPGTWYANPRAEDPPDLD